LSAEAGGGGGGAEDAVKARMAAELPARQRKMVQHARLHAQARMFKSGNSVFEVRAAARVGAGRKASCLAAGMRVPGSGGVGCVWGGRGGGG